METSKSAATTLWTGLGVVLAIGTFGWTMYAHLDNKLSAEVSALNSRLDARFDKIDARFDKIDARFEKNDARFERIDEKLNEIHDVLLEHNLRLEHIEGKLGIRHTPVGQEFGSGSKTHQPGRAPNK